MTRLGWRELVLDCVRRHDRGDSQQLDLLSEVLEEMDLAKQCLRDKGYGWTGVGILLTAQQVSDAS